MDCTKLRRGYLHENNIPSPPSPQRGEGNPLIMITGTPLARRSGRGIGGEGTLNLPLTPDPSSLRALRVLRGYRYQT